MLDLCKSIKKLYCIDSYQPYKDYYSEDYYVDQYEINIVKNLALKKITNADSENIVTFYEEDSNISVDRFEDGQVDFVFLDAHLDAEHIRNDLRKWYPKVRSGGMLMIHDTIFPTVKEEIDIFLESIKFDGNRCDVINFSALLKK
jgi:tRNA A58 N-methylase Trm61